MVELPERESEAFADGGAGIDSAVRPFVMSGGRTGSSKVTLDLLATATGCPVGDRPLVPEARRALRMIGAQAATVAEVAANLGVPLGVAQVFIADLAELGCVDLHEPALAGQEWGSQAERDQTLSLLRSVLDGIAGL